MKLVSQLNWGWHWVQPVQGMLSHLSRQGSSWAAVYMYVTKNGRSGRVGLNWEKRKAWRRCWRLGCPEDFNYYGYTVQTKLIANSGVFIKLALFCSSCCFVAASEEPAVCPTSETMSGFSGDDTARSKAAGLQLTSQLLTWISACRFCLASWPRPLPASITFFTQINN